MLVSVVVIVFFQIDHHKLRYVKIERREQKAFEDSPQEKVPVFVDRFAYPPDWRSFEKNFVLVKVSRGQGDLLNPRFGGRSTAAVLVPLAWTSLDWLLA